MYPRRLLGQHALGCCFVNLKCEPPRLLTYLHIARACQLSMPREHAAAATCTRMATCTFFSDVVYLLVEDVLLLHQGGVIYVATFGSRRLQDSSEVTDIYLSAGYIRNLGVQQTLVPNPRIPACCRQATSTYILNLVGRCRKQLDRSNLMIIPAQMV